MLFPAKQDIREKSDKLFAEAQSYNKGELIPHEMIETTIGFERGEQSYGSIFNKFRRRLIRERGITLLAVNGIGYRLLTDEEAVRIVPKMRRKKMYRQTSKAMAELSGVDQARLTPHQRLCLANSIERLEQERTQLRSNALATSSLLRTPHTLPRVREEVQAGA